MISNALLTSIAILNILTALYVYRRAPLPTPAKTFAFLALTIAGWTLALAQAHYGAVATTFFTRLTFAFASLMPVAILALFQTFPRETRLLLDLPSKLLASAGILFCALSLTPLIVSHAVLLAGRLVVLYGPLHFLYAGTSSACLLWSSWLLLSRYRRSTGVVRLQLRYFLLGIILPGLGVLTTNLLVPLFFNTSSYGQYGPYFALLFLLLTAHALIRYRLMDIRLVLRKGVALAISLGATSLVAISIYIAMLFISSRRSLPDSYALVLHSLTTALALPFFFGVFTRLLSSYAFRATPDYPRHLQTASITLSKTLELNAAAKYLLSTILDALHVEHAAFYLQSPAGYQLVSYQAHSAIRQYPPDAALRLDPLLIQPLLTRPTPILSDDVMLDHTLQSPALLDYLSSVGWAVALPVRSEGNLLAVLCLGPKLSTDAFFSADLTFLSALASHAYTAISNSTLYRQVLLGNQYLSAILASMDSGVVAVSCSGSIDLINRAALRYLSASSDETPPPEHVDALPDPLRAALVDTLADGISRLHREASLQDPSHTLIPVGYSATPLRGPSNQILGALLVINDLTVLKTLEAHAHQSERVASLSSVAVALAHEIKNPLVAIRTSAELLDERYTDAEFRAYFARVVISEISRIDELLVKLHTLGMPAPPRMTPLDIKGPLNTTLALLRGHLELKRISVDLDLNLTESFILGNEAQLRQLFLNILLNAINVSPVSSRLGISATTINSSQLTHLQIAVVDSGSGVPPSLLPTIFDPFVSGLPGGTGLGLAIARSIVHAHRGSIMLQNNPEPPGATLLIELPVHDRVSHSDVGAPRAAHA